jgi:hypothetical protein
VGDPAVLEKGDIESQLREAQKSGRDVGDGQEASPLSGAIESLSTTETRGP